jgi:hypothetical protein
VSATSVKAAISTLLSDGLGPTKSPSAGPIGAVYTSYPRSLPDALAPIAVIWSLGSREKFIAGGKGTASNGMRQVDYRVMTHLAFYGVDPVVTDEYFVDLTDQVLALYRSSLDLARAANTSTSALITFANEMEVITPQPADLEQGGGRGPFFVLQSVIVCQVHELIQPN